MEAGRHGPSGRCVTVAAGKDSRRGLGAAPTQRPSTEGPYVKAKPFRNWPATRYVQVLFHWWYPPICSLRSTGDWVLARPEWKSWRNIFLVYWAFIPSHVHYRYSSLIRADIGHFPTYCIGHFVNWSPSLTRHNLSLSISGQKLLQDQWWPDII